MTFVRGSFLVLFNCLMTTMMTTHSWTVTPPSSRRLLSSSSRVTSNLIQSFTTKQDIEIRHSNDRIKKISGNIHAIRNLKTILSMSSEQGQEQPDLSGKVIYQRLIHKLSPFSPNLLEGDNDEDYGPDDDEDDDVKSNNNNYLSIEERVKYKTDPSGSKYLIPDGRLTLILRGPPSSTTDEDEENDFLGPELYRIDVHESLTSGDDESKTAHSGCGESSIIESSIATILFLASQSTSCLIGNVLELQTDLGLVGLLGSVAAGYVEKIRANGGKHPEQEQSDEVSLLAPKNEAPLPSTLRKLTLSDGNEDMLNIALSNAKISGVQPDKVEMRDLDWSHHPRTFGKKKYHTIIASDCVESYPVSKELARTVAYSLDPLPYENDAFATQPKFIHVCPDQRDGSSYLNNFLQKGYKMSLDTNYVVVKKYFLKSLIIDEGDDNPATIDKAAVDVQMTKEATYKTLIGWHSPEYSGDNGEYIFPIETGEYTDGSEHTPGRPHDSSLYLEREWDTK